MMNRLSRFGLLRSFKVGTKLYPFPRSHFPSVYVTGSSSSLDSLSPHPHGMDGHDASTVLSVLRELPNMELDDGQKYIASIAFPPAPARQHGAGAGNGGPRRVEPLPMGKVLVPGSDLPPRPNRLCRIANCKNRYRCPGYLCEAHGGGRCQAGGCKKLHQGKKGLPDFFFCRFHRKRYSELSAEFDA